MRIKKDKKTGKTYFGDPVNIPITITHIVRSFSIMQYQDRLEKCTEKFSREIFEDYYKRSLTKKEIATHMLYYIEARKQFFKKDKDNGYDET